LTSVRLMSPTICGGAFWRRTVAARIATGAKARARLVHPSADRSTLRRGCTAG
jgi:hypothetical protein